MASSNQVESKKFQAAGSRVVGGGREVMEGNFYINISKTNQQLRSLTRFGAMLWNIIRAEIRQCPKMPSKIIFMNLCCLIGT